MSVNAIAAIENRMVRVIQNLHSNQVRVEVLPRTMSAAVPGARRRPDGTCGSGYSPLRISVEYMVSPMTRATATWSGTKGSVRHRLRVGPQSPDRRGADLRQRRRHATDR